MGTEKKNQKVKNTAKSRNYWLLKTEPGCFCWEEQQKAGTEPWDGVRNFQARKNILAASPGDLALFYHTGTERSVVGIVEIVSTAYPDPTDFEGKWPCMDVKTVGAFERPVSLAEMKNDPALEKAAFLKQGRLSVAGLAKEDFEHICRLGGSLDILPD